MLYDHPRNLFVAGFIGSPSMNLVHSELTAEDGGVYATLGETKLRLPAVAARGPALAAAGTSASR